MIRIGIVARPHGLRGGVVVTLDNPASDSLFSARYLHLGQPAKEPVRYEIRQVGPGRRGQQIVSLAGVSTPEAVDALRGWEVLLEEGQLPPLGEREYWFRDLLGLRAEAEDGTELGEVVEVVDTAEVPVLVVRGEAERFVPFSDPFVIEVKLDAGRIRVAPPEELES